MPEKPISPNRPLINLLGALAGIGLGVGLVALLEYRDSSFKTDDEVVSVLSLPVLAVIPMIVTTDERRRARRRKVRVVIASTATIIVAAVFIAWRLNLVNRFLR